MKHTVTVAAISLILLMFAPTLAAHVGWPRHGPGSRPPVGTRQGLELLVMGLQVAGVLALAWMKLAPGVPAAEWSLMGIQIALGVAGACCARFESGFALFAGATLVVLLLGAVLHTEDAARMARPCTATVHG